MFEIAVISSKTLSSQESHAKVANPIPKIQLVSFKSDGPWHTLEDGMAPRQRPLLRRWVAVTSAGCLVLIGPFQLSFPTKPWVLGQNRGKARPCWNRPSQSRPDHANDSFSHRSSSLVESPVPRLPDCHLIVVPEINVSPYRTPRECSVLPVPPVRFLLVSFQLYNISALSPSR